MQRQTLASHSDSGGSDATNAKVGPQQQDPKDTILSAAIKRKQRRIIMKYCDACEREFRTTDFARHVTKDVHSKTDSNANSSTEMLITFVII